MKKIKGPTKAFRTVFIVIDVILLITAALILITTLIFGGGGSAPSVMGHNIFIVETDDFPLFRKGSAVITEKPSAEELKEKNVIIFNNENGTPMIGEISSTDGGITVLANGDPRTVSYEDIVGKAVYYSEPIGAIVSFAVSPAGVCTIAILPCLAFVIFQLAFAMKERKAADDREEAVGFSIKNKNTDEEAAPRKNKADEPSENDTEEEAHQPVKSKKKNKKEKLPVEEEASAPKETEKTAEFVSPDALKKAEEEKAAKEAAEKAAKEAAEKAAKEAAEKAAAREAAEKAAKEAAEKAAAEEARKLAKEKTSAIDRQKLYEAAGLFSPMQKKAKPPAEPAKPVEKTMEVPLPKPEINEVVRTYQPKQQEKDVQTSEERLDSLFTEADDSDSDYDIDEILKSIEENRKNK